MQTCCFDCVYTNLRLMNASLPPDVISWIRFHAFFLLDNIKTDHILTPGVTGSDDGEGKVQVMASFLPTLYDISQGKTFTPGWKLGETSVNMAVRKLGKVSQS